MKKIDIRPSHVAVLVPSVEESAQYLNDFGFEIGPAEIWEGEGTKEIYVEKDKRNSLLLMEPVKPGAYRRAMEKRGPGFHHLAIDVLDLEEFLLSLDGTGWLLHPKSVKTIKQSQTAYLARPGFPALIEVQERKEFGSGDLFVTRMEVTVSGDYGRLISSIGLAEFIFPSEKGDSISLDSKTILLSKIISPGD